MIFPRTPWHTSFPEPSPPLSHWFPVLLFSVSSCPLLSELHIFTSKMPFPPHDVMMGLLLTALLKSFLRVSLHTFPQVTPKWTVTHQQLSTSHPHWHIAQTHHHQTWARILFSFSNQVWNSLPVTGRHEWEVSLQLCNNFLWDWNIPSTGKKKKQ